MTDELVSKIGWLYTGQDQVQKYLSDSERIARQADEFNRLSTSAVRSGAFEHLSAQGQSGLERTTLREYDDLTRATLRLRDAELARAQVHKQLAISDPASKKYNPQHPKFIGEWNYDENGKRVSVNETGSLMARERADIASLRAVDAAAKAQQQAFDNVNKAEVAEARRAASGQAKLNDWWEDRQYDQRNAQLKERAKVAAELNAFERRDTARAIQGYTTRAREDIKYNAVEPKYVDPDLTSKTGRLQYDVNEAASKLARAQNRQAEITTKVGASADERLRVGEQVRAAERRLILAENKLAGEMNSRAYAQRTASMAGGGGGGFGSQFMTGFHGRGDRPYAEQIGQAFKFSVFYGTAYKALFALTTTLQQTLQEGIEFQQAMTELKIASGLSADAAAEMADGLAAQATAAGAAPSQGVLLGARSLGLFGVTEASGASAAEQERVAEISARTALRMALGTKTDPALLQTQIAAVANAFGTGAQGQLRAADLDAYLGRRFGVVPGETIQSVAESGTVGQAAGFNQEEVFAIAAALQSRTGQTSSAVAGWMAQIFSRGGEGSLTALTGKYGIDQSADLATQIQELARVYQNASNTERAEIAAGFGRGKVQNAAVVMLDEFDTIMREAEAARGGASGEADKIFELRMNDIGGQIQQTVAVMKAFASELGQSGVLDVLGGVIITFRELVEAATSILEVWNQLPGVVKGAIVSIALLGGAARMAALSQGGAGLLTRAGLISPSLAASTGVRAPTGGIIAGAGASGFAAAGKAALATVGPFALAVGGLLAIGALKQSADRMREAQEAAEQALSTSGLTRESTSSDYIASASELDALAKQNRDATGGFTNFLTFGQADDDNIEMARRLEREAERRRAVADAIDANASENPIKAPAIADFQAETIKEALDLITASGGDADARLRLLTDALDGTADSAIRAATAIDDEFVGRMATSIRDGVKGLGDKVQLDGVLGTVLNDQLNAAGAKVAKEYEVRVDAPGTNRYGTSAYETESRTLNEVYNADQTTLQKRLKDQLAERGLTSTTDLDKRSSREIAESMVLPEDFDSELSDDQLADARKALVNMIARQLRGEALQWRKALKKNNDLTAADVAAIAENIDTEFEASREQMPENDLKGRSASWRRQLARLNQTRSQAGAGEDISGLMVRIGRAKAGLARNEIERLDQVRRAAQQNATSAAQIRRIGMRTIRGRVAAAIESGDVDVLAEVISNSGKVGVRIARKAIDVAIAAAKEAIQIQAAYAAISAYASGVAGMIGGIANSMGAVEELAGLQELQSALGGMTFGSAEETLQGTDVEGTDKYFPDPEKGKKKSKKDREAEREQARQEMLDLKNNLYLLSIDLSDPLAMATAAVKDARRRLQSDIASGQDRGTIAASRVALRQAQIEKEATAFQQRLEAVQTAEELGRISHRKYISYLESERKRLGAIKNRTYQQQQQLDEIDRLMKDAAESMQGQWNFGDIKLPTPYQVRRQVEQNRVDRATGLDATSARSAQSITTINIDGADTGKVRQIITETLGSANRTVTTRSRRR